MFLCKKMYRSTKFTPMLRSVVNQSRGFHSSALAQDKIGFIGCGNMGLHMAKNLIKAGHQVTAFDVVPAALEAAKAAGSSIASTPAEAADGADMILTMLPGNDHVRNAYTGEDGVFKSLPESAICIDSSTVDPAVSREMADVAAARGSSFVDAPVSGGVGGAEAGTLTFMVGGSESAYQQATPYLKAMGANIVHCGDVGTGEIAKLCNNMVLGISMIGVSEAMNMGSKLGMDRSKLAGILNTSTARCWSSDTYNPAPGVMDGVPSSRGYTGGFGSALMLKDLGLALDAAKAAGAPVPMGSSAQAFYQLLCENGHAGKDFSVAFKFLGGTDVDEQKNK